MSPDRTGPCTKRIWAIRLVLVALGLTVLSGAETREVKPPAKAIARASVRVEAEAFLLATPFRALIGEDSFWACIGAWLHRSDATFVSCGSRRM